MQKTHPKVSLFFVLNLLEFSYLVVRILDTCQVDVLHRGEQRSFLNIFCNQSSILPKRFT